ncbi:ABC transporter permease [Ochrobactrum sp. Q0168]|uniref:ABC transporter permease n=1 Tax=Ochrobactrum sp. Q0168 TaxID=2793241 RepID=UPI0018ED7056|nr:ABC transporter permease [Ochrobactrum sp. Q0168]
MSGWGTIRVETQKPIPFLKLLGPVLLLLIWAAASAAGVLDPRTLPAPWEVVARAWQLLADGVLQKALRASLYRSITGLSLGVLFGIVFALISGLSRWGEALVDGPLQIWRATPVLAVIPLAIYWLGLGEQMKITLICLTTMIPVYINTSAAIAGVDKRYVELAHTVRLTHWEFVWQVVLPGALPGFFTGLRLSAVSAWLVLVVVEQSNTISGLGYMVGEARQNGQVDIIAVGLVVYALLGLTTDTVLRHIETKVLSWRKTFR